MTGYQTGFGLSLGVRLVSNQVIHSRDGVVSSETSLPLQPVSVGDLVAKRLEATHRLQQNPADYEAHQTLAHIEQQVSSSLQHKSSHHNCTLSNLYTEEPHLSNPQLSDCSDYPTIELMIFAVH